jgi:hypothetical protein
MLFEMIWVCRTIDKSGISGCDASRYLGEAGQEPSAESVAAWFVREVILVDGDVPSGKEEVSVSLDGGETWEDFEVFIDWSPELSVYKKVVESSEQCEQYMVMGDTEKRQTLGADLDRASSDQGADPGAP